VKNLLNYALFQSVWFAAVWGAASGHLVLGFLAAHAMLAAHLAMLPGTERLRELGYLLAVTTVGGVADSVLSHAGLIVYPTSDAWTLPTSPPWILGLWLGFAMLPRFSLAWLRPRLAWAVVLGALGGPLSFYAGTRFGAISPGSAATWWALALEYAVLVPLMLRLAPRSTQPGHDADVA
jgi:hypothetical protein